MNRKEKIAELHRLANQPDAKTITAKEMEFLKTQKIDVNKSFASVWNYPEATVKEIDRIMKKRHPNFIIVNVTDNRKNIC